MDRIAEMKINTGIYIFCSPAWLASSKCISDLNLNNRDQPLPALHSILCQEIHCCHKENMYIPNIETYYYVKYKLYIILNISCQTVNINQSSDWEALVWSEV